MAKNKLRSIVVNDKKYLWKVDSRVIWSDDKEPEAESVFTVYLEGFKNTPLKAVFRTWDHPIQGNPLKTGYEDINLNKPIFARMFILEGIKIGWTGEKAQTIADGFKVLEQADFDVSDLKLGQSNE